MTEPRQIEVEARARGLRLDRYLAEVLDRSRAQIQIDIAERRVLVDGRAVRPSVLVKGGEQVTVVAPPPRPDQRIVPESGSLDVIWEDSELAVLDKPPGLAMHPGAGRSEGTLAHRLVARYPEIAEVGHPRRPGIVHRLDLDTSGVVVVARTDRAYQKLTHDFAARRVSKEYLAIAHGRAPCRAVLDQPISRHPTDRKRMSVRSDGRRARTDLLRLALASAERLSLLHIQLRTGRTHQIRVHLKHAAHPLVGDPVYGEARWKELTGESRTAVRAFPRPALHAWRLVVHHPRTGELLVAVAPPPEDLTTLWRAVSGDSLDRYLATVGPPPTCAHPADR